MKLLKWIRRTPKVTVNIDRLIDRVEITAPPCDGCKCSKEHYEKKFQKLGQQLLEEMTRSIQTQLSKF